jgi:Ala-tRNA(Pro) deacylase
MADTSAIYEFLRTARVPYTVVPHKLAFTAQEEAEATHVPGRDWAKVVICLVDDDPIEAVLPAPLTVDLDRLLELARGKEIRLADETELERLFPGCEPGAMPPFGPLYRQRVFVDVSLAAETEIAFNAGTHTDAISMRWADFAATVRPIVGSFAVPPPDRVGDFRLSFRE